MTWVRIDENMVDHPKIVGLSDRAFRLWITALTYANRQETDGKISRKVGDNLVKSRGKVAQQELLSAGLWYENGVGYVIHDYLEYQPSKAENCALREKRAAAGRIGGQRSKPPSKSEASASSLLEAKPKPVPLREESLTVQEDSTDEQATPRYVMLLLEAIHEPEHGQAHLELMGLKAQGASEADFRRAASAVRKKRPTVPRRYAAMVLTNAISERSGV